MRKSFLWLLLISTLPVAWALAQATGPEFRVNFTTVGPQTSPAVSSGRDGRFLVVWESDGQDGSGLGIFARLFDPSGSPASDEFQVNSFTSSRQSRPAVVASGGGSFVVVWESEGQDGSGDGVFARALTTAGTPLGSELQVNSFTSGRQSRPSVSADGAGNFVVVWESDGQDGSGPGVFGRRFAASGDPAGGEFQVNAFTPDAQQSPSVASSVAGGFVVVWQSQGRDGSGDGVAGRLYDPSGNPLGDEFVVNGFTTDGQTAPVAASDPAGNFVVIWQSSAQDGSGEGIYGQIFDASGAPLGSEFKVNATTAENQSAPSVAMGDDRRFVVVWVSSAQDGDGDGVFGQTFEGSGSPMGAEFQVSATSAGNQRLPRVATDGSGNFVFVWQSEGQDGDGYGIFGRR